MTRVVTKLATLLPGILAFIVAVAVFAFIGWLIAAGLRRLLTAAHFDQRLDKLGLAGWASISRTQSASSIFVRATFWAFVLIGLLVGFAAFDAASASAFTLYFEGYLPRIFAAIVILFVGTIIARFLARTILISAVNMNLQYARLLSVGIKWLVMVLTAAMILDHLAIGGEIVDLGFGILFGGIVLALALAVGLGSRDLVSRSLEREVNRPAPPPDQSKLRHF
jgi:hypothetical protein